MTTYILNGLQLLLDRTHFTAEVIKINDTNNIVFIPKSVFYDFEEYIITQIAQESFIANGVIKRIIFDEDSKIFYIGEKAFSYLSLTNIIIPRHVNYIGEDCFNKCNYLQKVDFEEDSELRSLEENIFNQSSINSLYIPSSVEELKDGWCSGTTNLFNISISPNNKNFIFLNNSMIVGKSDKNSDNFDSLFFVSIGRSAFNRSGIENISFPRSLKVIKRGTLQECEALETVSFPEDSELEIIEKNAFKFCSLKNLIIPKKVKIMEEGWCNGTESLENIEVSPENRIFDYDDSQNALYERIQKDDGIEVNLSFVDRSNDYFYVIPDVVHINDYAFTDCMSLECIEFDEKSKVVSIGRKALYGAPIRNIVTPKSTNKFGSEIFGECRKLRSAEFYGDDLIFGESCFNLCNELLLISFPNANRAIICIQKKYLNQLSLFTRPNAKIFNNMKI